MPVGYLYVAAENGLPVPVHAVGTTIRTPSAPPFLVVDHVLEGVVVARWPGRFFRVRTLPAADAAERATLAAGAAGLGPGARYVRALGAEVIEELPASRLFGEHGAAVAAVLAAADRLTLGMAADLTEADPHEAGAAYGRAWQRWHGSGAGAETGEPTLVFRNGSPIGYGFLVVHHLVRRSALREAGDAALTEVPGDPDDPEAGESVLAEPWAGAASALGHAAMALGAPGLVDDAAVLTAAWRAVRP